MKSVLKPLIDRTYLNFASGKKMPTGIELDATSAVILLMDAGMPYRAARDYVVDTVEYDRNPEKAARDLLLAIDDGSCVDVLAQAAVDRMARSGFDGRYAAVFVNQMLAEADLDHKRETAAAVVSLAYTANKKGLANLLRTVPASGMRTVPLRKEQLRAERDMLHEYAMMQPKPALEDAYEANFDNESDAFEAQY